LGKKNETRRNKEGARGKRYQPEQVLLGITTLPTMVSEGFTVHDTEWWRFDYKDGRLYPIGNQTFEQLSK
jgi:D-alanyl-D-alanine dipeptidase